MAEDSQCSVDSDTNFFLKRKRNSEEEEEEETLTYKSYNNPTKQLEYLVCLNFLSPEDGYLLRDDALSLKTKGFAYGRLADLLRLLYGHTVLELLDSRSFTISELLHDLRQFSFGGAWLDSLEHYFASSSCCSSSRLDVVSCHSLRKLVVAEHRLREDVVTLRSKVNSLRLQLES